MGYITSKSYHILQQRLDSAVQGGHDSATLHKILDLLFSEDEAKLVSVLPLNLFTVEDAAKKWGKNRKESKDILDKLADKGILFDFDLEKGKTQAYFLAPTMAGFFEFSLMRTDNQRDHKILSELLWDYLHKDQKYWKSVFSSDPCLARVYPNELGSKTHLTSNFVSKTDEKTCTGCEICVKKCPVGALKIVESKGKNIVKINEHRCFGCGVCVHFCPAKAIELKRAENSELVPNDSFERILLTALNKGKLQNYLIENNGIITHEILRRFIGFVLSLELSKKLLAQDQLRSRFIKMILKMKKFELFEKFLKDKKTTLL